MPVDTGKGWDLIRLIQNVDTALTDLILIVAGIVCLGLAILLREPRHRPIKKGKRDSQ